MKICPNCQNQVDDSSQFCTRCGARFDTAQQPAGQPGAQPGGAAPQYQYAAPQPVYQYDPYDHTAEFDAKDISDNKVYALLGYLVGIIGIIIALLAARDSKFAMFHVRQIIKITVTEMLMLLMTVLLFWTIIVPIAYGVMSIVFTVIRIICFFQVCNGKAKEPAIIRSLGFLK